MQFPGLYSRTLLINHFICNDLSSSYSKLSVHPSLTQLPLGNHKPVLCL